MRSKRNSKGYHHIFRVQYFNGTIGNIAGCNRKSEIQYGGRQTGSTHISAYRLDRNEIPTGTPIFSGSSISMELLGISPDVTGSQKFNMAAAKPEVLISQLLDEIETKFQRLPPYFPGPVFQLNYWEYRRM